MAGCATVKVSGPRNRGPHVLAGLRAGARPGAQRRHASRPTSAPKTTARSKNCSPAWTMPRCPPMPPRLPAGDPLYLYRRSGAAAPRPAVAAPVRSRCLEIRRGRSPAGRTRRLSPAGEARACCCRLSGSLSPSAAPGARRLPHRLLRRIAPSSRSRVLRHRRHAGRRSRRVSKAVAEGNDFVVGPLGRDEVAAVFRDAKPTVPMLALNRASHSAAGGQRELLAVAGRRRHRRRRIPARRATRSACS